MLINIGNRYYLYAFGEIYNNVVKPFWKIVGQHTLLFKICIPFDPPILVLGFYGKTTVLCIQRVYTGGTSYIG